MRKILKRFASFFLIPLTRWYLQKERRYTYGEISVNVLPGVFHPGLFHSTKFILAFLKDQQLANTSLLELGCGSGLISIFAAKAGAHVTASDLSLKAIENVQRNAHEHQIFISIVYSDLFERIDKKNFDWIIINPPYYPHHAKDEADLAWYCGENFEYFEKLFGSLKDHMNLNTQVIMVLTKGSDVEQIKLMGKNHGFEFELLKEKDVLFDEQDFLFRINLLVI